ncbi:hypothetical protein GO491_01170 [Flavobacteriaceae bacterium Ap0902]|nr:hypothetical protein [Flavobacteriaceae bacterium Ap0902]
MKLYYLFSLIFLILSCKNDEYKELGTHYVYQPDFEMLFDEYGIRDNGIYRGGLVDFPGGAMVIPPHIIDYKYNEQFIIAKCEFNKKDFFKVLSAMQRFNKTINKKDTLTFIPKYNPPYLNSSFYKKKFNSDSIFNNNLYIKNLNNFKISYYIIDKNTDIIYGPMNYKKFNLKYDSLNIKIDLKDFK